MKNIKIALAAFFSIIIVLWLSATTFPQQWGLIPTRNVLVQLTGSISFLAMQAA